MVFNDLEKQLSKYFKQISQKASASRKARVKLQVMRAFELNQKRKKPFMLLIGSQWKKVISSIGVLALIGVFVLPQKNNEVIAGVVNPLYGPVEIIRGEKSFLAEKDTNLLIGDFVKVGAKAQARISLPNQVVSVAEHNTQVKVTDMGEIFLVKGTLDNTVFRSGEFATSRGIIKSSPGAAFEVTVTETGETTVLLEKNQVEVFDLGEGSLSLSAGDSLTLRSDTDLSIIKEDENSLLSESQIQSIKAKLIIARSKVLSGIEKQFAGDSQLANKDINSAEQTFLSIAQALKTNRQKEISRRINLKTVNLEEVYSLVASKTKNQELLQEIRAVESLFVILHNNRGNLAFGKPNTAVTPFNKIVTLQHLYSLGTPDQSSYHELLKDKYVQNFLNDIYQNELVIDQISYLGSQIELLPSHPYTKDFLKSVSDKADPYIQQVLNQKIENAL